MLLEIYVALESWNSSKIELYSNYKENNNLQADHNSRLKLATKMGLGSFCSSWTRRYNAFFLLLMWTQNIAVSTYKVWWLTLFLPHHAFTVTSQIFAVQTRNKDFLTHQEQVSPLVLWFFINSSFVSEHAEAVKVHVNFYEACIFYSVYFQYIFNVIDFLLIWLVFAQQVTHTN